MDDVTFKGAKIALQVFIDEYSKECERKTAIDNKIISLLALEIAILTIFIPIIPFENIKLYFNNNRSIIIGMATIACMLLAISLIIMAVSFGILMITINVKLYHKVDIVELDSEQNLKQDANSVEKGLCDHYKTIILQNSQINDNKATKYQICLLIIIISFLLLTLGTILLKIL